MAILVFVIALAKSLALSFFGMNFFDYGETLHNATRILGGGVLYKDIWAIFPPADNYFPAFLLHVFGNNLLNIRFIESIIFAIFVSVVYLISRKLMSVRWSIFTSLLVVFADLNSYLLYFNLPFFLALLLVISFIESEKKRPLFLAGFLVGLGGLFRHDTSLAFMASISLAILLFSLIKHRKGYISNILTCCIGWLIPILLMVMFLNSQGTLGEFTYLSFSRAPNISHILSSNSNLNIFRPTSSASSLLQIYSIVSYAVYFSLLLAIAYYLFKRYKTKKLYSKDFVVLLLYLTSLFLVPYALSVIDMGHLIKAGVSMLILGTFIIEYYINQNKIKLTKTLLLAPLVIFLLGGVFQSMWWINYNDTKLITEKGYVYINSSSRGSSSHPTADTLKHTLKFIKENTEKGDYILALPYHAMIYYLSEREAPSKYNNFMIGFVPLGEQITIIDEIKKHDVKITVYDPNNSPGSKTLSDYNPLIHKYVIDNYETQEVTKQGWLLMKRKW